MKPRRSIAMLSLAALLAACGGGGSSSGSGGGSVSAPAATSTPVATATPAPTGACSLRDRQDWAAAQLREWYLFPETLPASLDPTPYASVESYIDALTATARSQRRDRYFTYLTSIASETAYYNSGETAGFGFRLSTDAAARRLFVSEVMESTPALAAGMDRGTEILAIGASVGGLRTVTDIIASEGTAGITNALGANTVGLSRAFRIRDASGATREVTAAKAEYVIPPVSSRYGAKVIDDGGRKVGYLNLRTFISTADPALRAAFAGFRAQGVTDLVVDMRYNGGGLTAIAELMTDLMGANRATSDVQGYTTFRAEKASNNRTRYFQPQAQSVAPMRVAFIGTGGTASASEFVINAMLPYLGNRAALVGTNTYGKPVGQIALDRAQCDDRLRVIAFATQNAARQGDYYNGLATTMQATCQAADDLSRPLGDPAETSFARALDFLAGRACTPIGTAFSTAAAVRRDLLSPDVPTTAQREVPGLY